VTASPKKQKVGGAAPTGGGCGSALRLSQSRQEEVTRGTGSPRKADEKRKASGRSTREKKPRQERGTTAGHGRAKRRKTQTSGVQLGLSRP